MTRKSKRELERAADALGGDADTVRGWARRYLEQLVAESGFDLEFSPSDGKGHVPLIEDRDGFTYYAPAADVPEWIDREDLPVNV